MTVPVRHPLACASTPPAPVPSPCVNLCHIDTTTGCCEGCARTLDEIAAWSRLDDAAKQAVWALLPARRAQRR